ncbi:Protein of unknown function [Gryllus bimaculatus]|nr:Protein of unknown function [Gryllus bimaculatus]
MTGLFRPQAKFMMMEEEGRLEHELYMWERRRHMDLEQMGDTLIKARNTLEAARLHTETMREEALLGVPEARQVLVKEAMGKDKGKKGKGGKGRNLGATLSDA